MIATGNIPAKYSRGKGKMINFRWSEKVEKESKITFLNEIVFTLGFHDGENSN